MVHSQVNAITNSSMDYPLTASFVYMMDGTDLHGSWKHEVIKPTS